MNDSLPGSSVHGILQSRILEWVAIPFSRGSSQPRDWTQVSHIAGGFFAIWATREAPTNIIYSVIYTYIFSYIYIYIQLYIHIFISSSFLHRSLQDSECSFLCCTIGPCFLTILYTVECKHVMFLAWRKVNRKMTYSWLKSLSFSHTTKSLLSLCIHSFIPQIFPDHPVVQVHRSN